MTDAPDDLDRRIRLALSPEHRLSASMASNAVTNAAVLLVLCVAAVAIAIMTLKGANP